MSLSSCQNCARNSNGGIGLFFVVVFKDASFDSHQFLRFVEGSCSCLLEAASDQQNTMTVKASTGGAQDADHPGLDGWSSDYSGSIRLIRHCRQSRRERWFPRCRVQRPSSGPAPRRTWSRRRRRPDCAGVGLLVAPTVPAVGAGREGWLVGAAGPC